MSLSTESHAEPRETEEVARGILRVPLETPTLPPATRTNAYVVRGLEGLWLVDPGSADPGECARLGDALRLAQDTWELPLRGAILTHHHPDHVGGLGWWASNVALPVVADHRTISLCAGAVGSDELDELSSIQWQAVDGDATVDGLELIFTPGHAPGHLAIWTGEGHAGLESRVLLAGDLVSGIGTIIVAPPRGNMAHYLDSLRRAAELGAERLFPSHGPGTLQPRERLEAYISHRLAREERVLQALDATTVRDLDAITAQAYQDVPGVFLGFASQAVLAHLAKLIGEGRAREVAEGYLASTR